MNKKHIDNRNAKVVRNLKNLKGRPVREPVRLITTPGLGVKPGVDLDNSRLLLDIMKPSAHGSEEYVERQIQQQSNWLA